MRNILAVIVGIALVATLGINAIPQLQLQQLQKAHAMFEMNHHRDAPVAISGENVYVTWWTNNTANNNEEIMFRVSNDSGSTFGDKINLSDTPNTDSIDAMIDSDADSVVVTWWETNQTSDAPVMRVSTDNGASFGPLLALATNGTIGEGGEAPEEAE
jgi:hypothetical protein